MNITDEELLMLEHLTYINEKVAETAKVNGFTTVNLADFEGDTVYEILQQFDSTAIANLEAKGDEPLAAEVSGKEWAQIITYLKNDIRINNLVLTETMETSGGTPLALCFTDGSENTNEVIVAFKGTTGGDEWRDNVMAATLKETEDQMEALRFIQGLSYSDITLTGHSKGANKTNYITILCDKVTRCVGFDPQGFSKLFLDDPEYSKRIEERAHLITNYSLSTDFVHILLYEIPGVEQVFCKGFGVDNIGQNHSPNSFFYTDDYGSIVLYGNYYPMFIEEDEDESVALLRGCVRYLLETGDEQEVQDIVEYVSDIMYKYGEGEDMLEYALSDLDRLSTVLGGILSYIDQNDISKDEIEKIADLFGVGFFKETLIKIVIDQGTDDDDTDTIFTTVAWALAYAFTDLNEYISGDEFKELWKLTESKYKRYNEINDKESSSIFDLVINNVIELIAQGNFNIIFGTSSTDELHGTDSNDMIFAFEENDNILAGSGDDLIFGGEGNDVIYGDSGNDTIYGGNGNDYIDGGDESDKIFGEAGDDTIYGGGMTDYISGGDGNDWIDGGLGIDLLFGDDGDDIIFGRGDKDHIEGGNGNDHLYGGDGDDEIYGDSEDDSLGYTGDDILYGDSGNDKLFGIYLQAAG